MNFLKRACLYCFRQRTKTVILFLLFTVILTLLLDGLAVCGRVERATAGVRRAVGGKLVLEIDTEGNFGEAKETEYGTSSVYTGDYITQPIIDSISGVEGVSDYNVEDYAAAYYAGVSFRYIPTYWNLNLTKYGDHGSFTACLSSERCSAFESGRYTLIAGRHITPSDSHVLLISKELADYNGISVGDIVTIYDSYLDSEGMDPFVEMEIAGIFNGTEGTATGEEIIADQLQANCGFVAYNTLFDMYDTVYKNGPEYLSVTIYVSDAAEMQRIYDEIGTLPEIQGKTLKLRFANEEYEAVETPLETLVRSINMAIMVIAFTGFAVVTLFLAFCAKGRKREIGILLSVGKSKADIFLQFLTEIYAALSAAFLTAVLLSNLTVAGASRILLSGTEAVSEAPAVQLPAEYLLLVCCMGFLLAALSAAASSWTICRLEPKDILTKYE